MGAAMHGSARLETGSTVYYLHDFTLAHQQSSMNGPQAD